MIKTLSLIKRLPTISREAFRDHYETCHAPLALPHLKGLQRYVRYHVEEELLGGISGQAGSKSENAPFDVISAFWFRDAAATAELFEMLASKVGKPILEDEQKFMDKPENRFFPVSERLWREGDEGKEHIFVFVARPSTMTRYDCSRQLTDDHWPALVGALGGAEFALLRDAFPMEGEPELWDAMMQLRAENTDSLGRWSDGMNRDGYRVAAVRTRRFETPLSEAP